MSQEKIKILVTGGAGFIGSAFVKEYADDYSICVVDKLTYAGNIASIKEEIDLGKIRFEKADICDADAMAYILGDFKPHYIINFAAESHVDRSVDNPKPFVDTNIAGTQNLLECARRYAAGSDFKRFVQISTDEVYGDLPIGEERKIAGDFLGRKMPVTLYGPDGFTEETPLHPSSPYSASKASADFMAMAYHRTYGLPVVITRCSNNYGPRQFPEKLIPLMLNNILEGRELPVYGNGSNVRDWIHVSDHCRGIMAAATEGQDGYVYNFGSYNEVPNLGLVKVLIYLTHCIIKDNDKYAELRNLLPSVNNSLIKFVGDRPGHDRRYAIDSSRAMQELGWRPRVPLAQGLRDTIEWYLDNRSWTEEIVNGEYRSYYTKMYSGR